MRLIPPFRPLIGIVAVGAGMQAGCGGANSDAAAGSQIAAAGGTSQAAATCTVDASAQPTCPTPEPSYSAQVKEIINSTCQACHASGGVGAATSGPGGRGIGRAGDATDPSPAQDANHRPANFDPDTMHDWSVLANVQRDKTKMMQQVFLCQMPPPDASTLVASDRSILLSWLKCGAKDN